MCYVTEIACNSWVWGWGAFLSWKKERVYAFPAVYFNKFKFMSKIGRAQRKKVHCYEQTWSLMKLQNPLLLFARVFYVALHRGRKVESKPATDVTSYEYSWGPVLLLSFSIQAFLISLPHSSQMLPLQLPPLPPPHICPPWPTLEQDCSLFLSQPGMIQWSVALEVCVCVCVCVWIYPSFKKKGGGRKM